MLDSQFRKITLLCLENLLSSILGVYASLLHTSPCKIVHPVGMFDISPAVHCWVDRRENKAKSRRDEQGICWFPNPAIKSLG